MTDRTFYENPWRIDPDRIHHSADPEGLASATGDWRADSGISKARTVEEILRRQKGFEDLRANMPLPSSSEISTNKSELSRMQIKARIGQISKDFARMAACPEGIERLRVLALVAMDAYQPDGYKFIPQGGAEEQIYDEAKDAWENLCTGSELSDLHCRRRAVENLVGTYNGALRQCKALDKAKGWHFFDSHRPITVPTERRDVGEGLDGWFDVPKYPRGMTRNSGSNECWCYEERIGPDGKPRGEVVKREKPTVGQYAVRALDYALGAQSPAEFAGALIGTMIGCGIAAAHSPYMNSIGEQTAEKMVLLKRIEAFTRDRPQEEENPAIQKGNRDPRRNRSWPKNGAELSRFANAGPSITVNLPPVTGNGYTMQTPHGPYIVIPHVQSRSAEPKSRGNGFHHPPDNDGGPPVDGREGSENQPSL
jgi:hypothetical protein